MQNTQSPYTPTTEEVRARYSADEFGYSAGLNDPCPEFDRWLLQERHRVAEMAIKKERRRAITVIMTNIGQIVWQARHNPEGESIDTSKMLKEIMGVGDE